MPMKKNPLIILLLGLVLSSCLSAQTDGQILSQTHISRDTLLQQFSHPRFSQRFVQMTPSGADWQDVYGYYDSLQLSKITYMSEGLKVKGYVLQPKISGNYPCIIYNRGGNRDFGMLTPFRVFFLLGNLARKGYVVISSNYRGVDGAEGMEEFGGREIQDVLNLIPALAQIESADTSRIGMYGWSRGGMMTYIALTKTPQIKAAVVGGAVSDNFETIRDRPDMETHVLAELIPDYEHNKEEELNKRSAIKWADAFPQDVPILMLHGSSDWRVKPEHSLRLALELEKYRVPYRLIMFEGADHGIREFRPEVERQVLSWFDRFVKNGEPLPNMDYHGR